MARRAISEKGKENGNKKKGKVRLMKQKAGPRTITEEEKKKRLAAKDLKFLRLAMGINGFLNVGQIKTSHLILILGNLGCRSNSISENMIRKKFKKGKNCIIPSRELYEAFERSFQEDSKHALKLPRNQQTIVIDENLKVLQMFLEAFYDESLSPSETMQNAWYVKTFFILWDKNKPSSCSFVSQETFKDVVCALDGLLLYFLRLKKDFPKAPIVTKHLGSDLNEQGFAFVRNGVYEGRRLNINTLRMAYSFEKLNRFSEINKHYSDLDGVAHTRGRRVLPTPPGLDLFNKSEKQLFYGEDNVLEELLKCMEQGTKDCLDDCRRYNLGFVKEVSLSIIRLSEESDDEELPDEPLLSANPC